MGSSQPGGGKRSTDDEALALPRGAPSPYTDRPRRRPPSRRLALLPHHVSKKGCIVANAIVACDDGDLSTRQAKNLEACQVHRIERSDGFDRKWTTGPLQHFLCERNRCAPELQGLERPHNDLLRLARDSSRCAGAYKSAKALRKRKSGSHTPRFRRQDCEHTRILLEQRRKQCARLDIVHRQGALVARRVRQIVARPFANRRATASTLGLGGLMHHDLRRSTSQRDREQRGAGDVGASQRLDYPLRRGRELLQRRPASRTDRGGLRHPHQEVQDEQPRVRDRSRQWTPLPRPAE